MEAHVELKSFGVVFAEHDEGWDSACETTARDALKSANCSNFILDGGDEVGLSVVPQELRGGSCT